MNEKKRNTNFCYVKVREDRSCTHCGSLIKKGTRCITVNKKSECRKWLCEECYNLQMEILNAKVELDLCTFGDEGGAMAMSDALDELKEEYESRSVE